MPHHGGLFTVRRHAAAGSVLAAAVIVACYFALSASGSDGLADGDAAAGGGPVGETVDSVRQGPGLGEQRGPESGEPASAPVDHQRVAVQLDAAAGGQTVGLQVGQQLVVTLGPRWSPPRTQTPASDIGASVQPLRIDLTSGVADTAAGSVGSAVFTAVRVGQAVVFAHASTGADFTITVVVQPVPGQGAGPLPVRAGVIVFADIPNGRRTRHREELER